MAPSKGPRPPPGGAEGEGPRFCQRSPWSPETDAPRHPPSRTRKPWRVALPMAAMMAVGGGQHQGAGQKTTRMVTARMISPGDCPGDPCRDQGDDHDPGGPAVGQVHDLGLALAVGGLDQADHPLDGTVLPTLVASMVKAPNWFTVPLATSSPSPCPRGGTRRSSPPG